jgi:membrane-associated protease RseP (regulator of RpoE activity)
VFPEDLFESATRPVEPERPESLREFHIEPHSTPKHRLWVHVLLLIATLFTTTLVGAHMQYNFDHNLPVLDIDHLSEIYSLGLSSFKALLGGLPFSLTLMTILMAHELGHYFACVYYGLDATLPFFLPVPMPMTGTMGAFIRIRSPIQNKRVLFDVGVAGPLAGFLFLVPALGVGLAFSKVLPGINNLGAIHFGAPPLEWIAQRLVFPGVAGSDIYLHPVARAAWVGMFATALNLLPVGQLDGGHIVYALLGRFQKWISQPFLLALLPMGYFWWRGWLFWFALLAILARRHPPVYDETPAGATRIRIGVLALVVFALCFSIAPLND